MIGLEFTTRQQTPEEILEQLPPVVGPARVAEHLLPVGALLLGRWPAERAQVEFLHQVAVPLLPGEQLLQAPVRSGDLLVEQRAVNQVQRLGEVAPRLVFVARAEPRTSPENVQAGVG